MFIVLEVPVEYAVIVFPEREIFKLNIDVDVLKVDMLPVGELKFPPLPVIAAPPAPGL